MKLTPAQKAIVGKRAGEHGVTVTIRYFSPRFSDLETTVRRLKNNYTSELRRKRHCEVTEVTELQEGRPQLLGEELDDLDQQVKTYLHALRSSGVVVNTAIALACAQGIVISNDANLLACNGRHITLTKFWAKILLSRMGFVKRRGTTKAKQYQKCCAYGRSTT